MFVQKNALAHARRNRCRAAGTALTVAANRIPSSTVNSVLRNLIAKFKYIYKLTWCSCADRDVLILKILLENKNMKKQKYEEKTKKN